MCVLGVGRGGPGGSRTQWILSCLPFFDLPYPQLFLALGILAYTSGVSPVGPVGGLGLGQEWDQPGRLRLSPTPGQPSVTRGCLDLR